MRHIEENTQMACVKWFAYQYPQYYPYLHHSPNGGKRNVREGARFKAMGVKAGFPDIAIYLFSEECRGLFIEMKTGKGRQTESQKEWQRMLVGQGCRYEVCRSFEEFKTAVESYIDNYKNTVSNE